MSLFNIFLILLPLLSFIFIRSENLFSLVVQKICIIWLKYILEKIIFASHYLFSIAFESTFFHRFLYFHWRHSPLYDLKLNVCSFFMNINFVCTISFRLTPLLTCSGLNIPLLSIHSSFQFK